MPRTQVLDSFFKNYFWVYGLGALFVGGFLHAKVVNLYVAQVLEVPVSELYGDAPARATSRGRKKSPITASASAFLDRNPFDAEIEVEAPPTPPEGGSGTGQIEAKTEEVYAGSCDPTLCEAASMGANLLATLWSGDSASSSAIFQATSGGEILRVSPGDRLLDEAEVTAVLRNIVCISRGGQCEIFDLKGTKKRVNNRVAKAKAAPPKPSGANDFGKGIKRMANNKYEIPKTEIDNVLSNMSQIAKMARIVPSFKNGKSNGFKLFSIRPNSLYAKIGIQNGDVIQRINGYEMNSPDKALQIYSKLKDASAITVDIVRRGKPVSMNYNIR